MDNTKA